MITVEARRPEALRAGYLALQDRISIPFDAFTRALESWDVKAFCKGKDVVGMLMLKDDELHVAVLPEVRGKWLSRRLIKEVLGPLVKQYGTAKTKVSVDNPIGQEFVKRIGFASTDKEHAELLREGFERKYFDPMTAIATSVAGSLIGAGASQSAANTQANAANRATDTQLQMFNTINQQQAPWRQAGQNALSQIGQLMPDFTRTFNANDLKSNLAPNYAWQLEQGLGAVKNAGNLQSGLIGGNTLRGVNDYAQNYAGNAYQNAFNNYNAMQTNIFNRLSNIAGLGQTANQSVANTATGLAPSISNTQVGAGAAQAAGTIGAANAITGGMNNALGWYSLPQLMNYGSGGGNGTYYIDNSQG